MTPKVSVCITAYNHEKYIAQALDSVLAQKTDFAFEIIVGEDDSSDQTRKIVQKYAGDHPDTIRPIYNSRDDVIVIQGRATGRRNFVNNLKHASGEYIALLDGDDFWIDEDKLQKQIELLDRNRQYALCYTNARIYDENTHAYAESGFCESYAKNGKIGNVTFDDIINGHWIPTGSVVFRRKSLKEVPDWFLRMPYGDWGLFLLLLNEGPALYYEKHTTVYRVHNSNLFFGLSLEEKYDLGLVSYEMVWNQFGREKAVLFCNKMVAEYRRRIKKWDVSLKNLVYLYKYLKCLIYLRLRKAG